jgi:hypothetical protein
MISAIKATSLSTAPAHRQERDDTSPDLGGERAAPLLELKVAADLAKQAATLDQCLLHMG